MGVDFDGDTVVRAGFQDALHIDLVAWTPQKLASGDVAENGGVGILDRLEDAGCLFFLAHPEFTVHAGDDEIEGLENVF